jgi:DNA-binding CsgD family transcriptional regulator
MPSFLVNRKEKEKQVLKLVHEGKNTREIANPNKIGDQ